MVWVIRDLKTHLVPCQGQGHLPVDQIPPSPAPRRMKLLPELDLGSLLVKHQIPLRQQVPVPLSVPRAALDTEAAEPGQVLLGESLFLCAELRAVHADLRCPGDPALQGLRERR